MKASSVRFTTCEKQFVGKSIESGIVSRELFSIFSQHILSVLHQVYTVFFLKFILRDWTGDKPMITATWKLNLDWIMDIVKLLLEIPGCLLYTSPSPRDS